jgi:hypothetical protein
MHVVSQPVWCDAGVCGTTGQGGKRMTCTITLDAVQERLLVELLAMERRDLMLRIDAWQELGMDTADKEFRLTVIDSVLAQFGFDL